MESRTISLFLGGDVMTGRGIDQILPVPSKPQLYEKMVKDARDYVSLAELRNGPVPRQVPHAYIWGEALEILEQYTPDIRLINLETAVTRSDSHWEGKGVNYRMHPDNVPCLEAARIDCCALANNHTLDWGYAGLTETLATLKAAGIQTAGAGQNRDAAFQPAILEVEGKGRVIVFSFGMPSSGIPDPWAATTKKAGLNVLKRLSDLSLSEIREQVTAKKQAGDLLVASVHWGSNWGYGITYEQKEIAHQLIDEAGFDIIHGHSSHHFKGLELYRGKPIFYGCGDLINDYEGIRGYETFRSDLPLLYFLEMTPDTRRLLYLHLIPMQIRRLRLQHAARKDTRWAFLTMQRECEKLGVGLQQEEEFFSVYIP